MQRIHLMFSIPLATFILAVSSNVSFAQAPSERLPVIKGQPVIAVSKQESNQAADTKKSGASSEDPLITAHNKKKMEAIGKLIFDRRSSTIIKAWATPPGKEQPEENKVEAQPDSSTNKQAENIEKPLTAEQKKEAEKREQQKKLDAEFKQFEKEIKTLQRNVTLGNWSEVKAYFEQIEEKQYKALYKQLLTSLQTPPRSSSSQFMQFAEKNVITIDDFFFLASLLPEEKMEKSKTDGENNTSPQLTAAQLAQLAQSGITVPSSGQDHSFLKQLAGLFGLSIQNGHSIKEYLERFRKIIKNATVAKQNDIEKNTPGQSPIKPHLTKRQVAKLLADSNHAQYLKEFLPTIEQAIEKDDREALNLLSRYYLSLPQHEKKNEHLEKAWSAIQAVLAVGEITQEEKEEALKRAVELTPRIKEELGQAWLNESFSKRPGRGKEILSTIGSAVATGLQSQARNSYFRLKSLELQKTAVDALLKAAPEQAKLWKPTLQMMATNWLREAQTSQTYDHSTQRGRSMQRDYYGNYYFYDSSRMMQQQQRQKQIQAIATGKILELIPGPEWIELVEESLQPQFTIVISKLYLKVQEEEEAFPYIEKLAPTHPREAKSLAEEFLRVWTKNHNPNSEQQRTNMYMFAWGFNQRSRGIPLTRSKQVRNLEELSKWIKRINDLPIETIDEALITQAFTQVHSAAEVYQLEAIEKIYGTVDGLDPDTLASLIQTMRANLGKVWRLPATQKKAKTNRKQKDIEREVLQGYATAQIVLEKAIKKYPESWSVQLAKAALEHDANEFQQELKQTTEFSKRRKISLDGFKKAAELYAVKVESLEEEKQQSTAYETWFYASLGAPDLGKISHESVSDPAQFKLIRKAIEALPGELAQIHLDKFANSLFVRLSSLNPGVKFRYLKAGFEIVGDHEQAREAKKVYDYYNDLVTEIKLETVIDGSDVVGHSEPFGLFVNIRHTKEIERESGGFAKYFQNQNQGGYYYYNYGRPLENYREKFEEATKTALEEHFEILSITFEKEDVHSRATKEYGWRITPYAYVLLKPKGAEVDKIPSLTLDMDFMDTSGYAIIPISSSALPLDASSEAGDPRPLENLQITQTLDEREAKEGKLKLEVRATGVGLIPDLDKILDLNPQEFNVTSIENEGVAVSQFDKEGSKTAVNSERIWLVSMEAKAGLTKHPEKFSFGLPEQEQYEVTYQRFVDADLASVEPEILLEQEYGTPEKSWIIPAIAAVCLLFLAVGAYKMLTRKEKEIDLARYHIPEKITPFTVLGVLKEIERNNGLSDAGKQELGNSITRLEQFYFEQPKGNEPDLNEIVNRWVSKSI